MTSPDAARRARRLGIVAIVLLALVAYAPAIAGGGFIWDDDDYLTRNVHVQSAGGLLDIWTPGNTHQYYPLVFTTFWIEFRLWGLDPLGYHLVNVLLHALTAILAWRLLERLGVPGAWLVGAVFALHPVHVESVAWITERKNVLSGVLYLASAHAWLRFDAAPGEDGAAPPRRGLWYGLCLLAFVGALLAKSVTATLPAALVLVMLLERRPITWRRLAPLVPLVLLGAAAAAHTAWLEQSLVGATGAAFERSFVERLLVAARALLFYPTKLLVPWPVMFVYPRWTVDPGSIAAWIPLAVVAGLVAVTIAAFRRGVRAPFVALAFSAGTVAPALGFLNVYPHQYSFVADHFQYLASLGVLALVVGAAWRVARRPGPRAVLTVAILAPLLALTWRQSATYASAEMVWRDTLAKNDTAWLAHNNLSTILLRRAARTADPAEAAALAVEARGHAERVIALVPDHMQARANLAEALRLLGDDAGALASLERAIAIVETWMRDAGVREPPAYLAPMLARRGWLHEALGDDDAALADYAAALAITPGLDLAERNATRLLVEHERWDEAEALARERVERRPGDAEAHVVLAGILEQRGARDEALDHFRRAVALAPDDATRVGMAARVIRLILTVGTPSPAELDEATRLATWLVDVTGGRDAAALDVLAEVHAAAGRPRDAVATAERALAIARRTGPEALVRRIEANLAAHRAADGAPERDPL